MWAREITEELRFGVGFGVDFLGKWTGRDRVGYLLEATVSR